MLEKLAIKFISWNLRRKGMDNIEIIVNAIVISAEIFNTALEQMVDIAMPEKDPRAKFVKDVAAGGVLVMAIASAVIGLIIFIPKVLAFLETLS